MLIEKCAKRRETLPVLPCDCEQCVWYIRDTNYNDCFWVLLEVFNLQPGFRLSFEEIAVLENIPLKEVLTIFETALKKIREQASEDFTDMSEEI